MIVNNSIFVAKFFSDTEIGQGAQEMQELVSCLEHVWKRRSR